MELLEVVADLVQRGRSRLVREHYADWVPQRSGEVRPQPWVNSDLRDAIRFVTLPTEALLSGEGGAAGRVLDTAVAARATIAEHEVAFAERADGSAWKLPIHEADLALLCRMSSNDCRGEERLAYEALTAPMQHFASQLGEVREHMRELSRQAGDVFTYVSAVATRDLLRRTDGARTAAVVVGVLTLVLGLTALFATIAAIPDVGEREIASLNRAVAAAGLMGALGAAAGLVAAWLAPRALSGTQAADPPVLDQRRKDARAAAGRLVPESDPPARAERVLKAAVGVGAAGGIALLTVALLYGSLASLGVGAGLLLLVLVAYAIVQRF